MRIFRKTTWISCNSGSVVSGFEDLISVIHNRQLYCFADLLFYSTLVDVHSLAINRIQLIDKYLIFGKLMSISVSIFSSMSGIPQDCKQTESEMSQPFEMFDVFVLHGKGWSHRHKYSGFGNKHKSQSL